MVIIEEVSRMKKIFSLLVCTLMLFGCSSTSDVNYEELFKEIVSSYSTEYLELYNNPEKFKESGVEYLKEKFDAYFTDDTLNSLINKNEINVFYDYTAKHNLQIEWLDSTITNDDNHYKFKIDYKLDGESRVYSGNFQIDAEGKINYYKVLEYGIDPSDFIKE